MILKQNIPTDHRLLQHPIWEAQISSFRFLCLRVLEQQDTIGVNDSDT